MSSEAIAFEQQYHALRAGLALVELADWSSITIRGDDRQAFLHNFCTNDVKRLTPGQGCETFFTNVKGKIVGHGLVSCREQELVIIGVPGQAPPLIAHLDRYVIREKVELLDSTVDRCFFLVAGGADAQASFERWRQQEEPGTNRLPVDAWNLVGSYFARLIEIARPERRDMHRGLTEHGFKSADEAFLAVRIEAGVPLFGVDFSEQNLPQEVGRDREAISFSKGCYLGQETVARIDALGHVNQRLVGVRFLDKNIPPAGMDLLHQGRYAGQVTSIAFSPVLNNPLALAMVRREANSVGTTLNSAAGKGEVISLPVIANKDSQQN